MKRRIIPLFLALLITVSMVTLAFSVMSVSAADPTIPSGTTLYFNTSGNTSWNSTSTYAVFYDSSGKRVDSKAFASAGTNLYSVAPSVSTATSVQLVQLNSTFNVWPKADAKASGTKRRVVFKNTSNWSTPYVYAWSGAGDSSSNRNAAYPGVAMSNLSGDLWYYDTAYDNLIFNHGVNDGKNKTADLSNPANDNDVYSYATGWAGNLYSKASQTTDFSVRSITGCSNANEIYVSSSGKLTMSKFPYNSRTFSGREKTVYLYNPNWTNAYVTYDFNDPYRFAPVKMTAMSGKPKGFFQATVPSDAHFKFTPGTSTTGSSQEAWFGSGGDSSKDCYVISGSNEHWATVATATEDKADYYVNVGTDGNKNSSACWVEATYFDYMDDKERTNASDGGWLKPKKAGNNQDGGWYPFNTFNYWIRDNYAGDWATPLYFGNFNNNNLHDNFAGYYNDKTAELTNFVHCVNNSMNDIPSFYHSVLGLATDSLDASGNLLYPKKSGGTGIMPFFNRTALGNNAKTVSGYFPFNKEGSGSMTTYKFQSCPDPEHNPNNGYDNVYFRYANGAPTTVNFSSASNDMIKDGAGDFGLSDSYIGIFPFNGGINNPGNGNLDYGFGIKLDVDFRVPAGGKNGNEDVKFYYKGDDDLWVYISPVDEATGQPDYTKSKLVLDLGGDHKMSEGNINFNTMKSYIDKGVRLNKTASGSTTDVTLNASAVNNGNEVWYAYTWNNDNDSTWIKASGSNASSLKFSNLKSKVIFVRMNPDCGNNPGWGYKWNQTGNLTTRYGGTYTITGWDMNGSWGGDTGYTDVSNQAFKFAKKNFYGESMDMTSAWGLGSDGRLDPDKTYHLTIFYMERGLINSNNMMTFSMTPASNLLSVTKEVKVDDVNAAMQDDVRSKDSFTFASTDGTTTRNANLHSGGNISYDKVFKTNYNTKVKETFGSNLYYKTDWKVYDPDTGTMASVPGGGNNQGSATYTNNATDTGRQSSFTLVNPTNSLNTAKLRADYVNTPQVSDLVINKVIYEEDGQTVANNVSATFNFTIGIDVAGGSDYKYYNLDYEVSGHSKTMTNGAFSFNSNDTVTISGIPRGATYKIVESGAAGYTCMNSQSAVTGTINIADNIATFNNKITPTTTKIDVTKKVATIQGFDDDGYPVYNEFDYSGDLFSFKIESVPPTWFTNSRFNGKLIADGSQTIMNGTTPTGLLISNNMVNGKLSFNLKFTVKGYYMYKASELMPIIDMSEDSDHYCTDFSYDFTEYYVLYQVRESGDDLQISTPEFYHPVYPDMISDDTPGTGTVTDIKPERYELLSGVTKARFVNPITPGSVTVNKQNQDGSDLNNVEFVLFKVGDTENLNRGIIENEVRKFKNNETSKCIQAGATENGTVNFENLQIFKDGFNTIGLNDDDQNSGRKKTPEYQRYALAEVDPTNGYNLNGEVHYFTLPMWKPQEPDPTDPTGTSGSMGEWAYHITYDYVNGKLVSPNTSGEGMAIFRTVGISLLGVSMLLLVGFVVYHGKKRRAFEKRARHYIPKH